MSKEDAYLWLSGLLDLPREQAHISYLGTYYCRQVIEESKRILELKQSKSMGDRSCFGHVLSGKNMAKSGENCRDRRSP